MRSYGFNLTEYDPVRPWIVLTREHHETELGETVDFFDWAAERWPAAEFRVDLDPESPSSVQEVVRDSGK